MCKLMAPVSSARRAQSPPEKLNESIMSCLGSSTFSNSASALPLSIPTRGSPDPDTVDPFITDLLQAVTRDGVPVCTSCEESMSASSRCRDCCEILCDPCVRAHQRVRITKDHRIVRFSSDVTLSETVTTAGSLGSSQASNSPCSSGMGTSNNCEMHHEPHRLYCETCIVAICTECTLIEHKGHQLVYLQDAVDNARTHTVKLCGETRAAISAVREAIENVQRIYEGVEVRSHQAAADVRGHTKRFVSLLQERERELLSRIEQLRVMKGKALHSQMENLRLALSKLVHTSELLNDSLDNGNSMDLILNNEKAAIELKQIRSIRSDLIPCDDDTIMFIPPDVGFLRMLSTMGNVTTSPNSMMLRPCVKEPQISNQILPFLPSMELKPESELQMCNSPKGRPILGALRPVIVKDYSRGTPLIFGTEGDEDGQLCRPWGVCCDRNGQVIVADRSNNRIQVFRPNGIFSHKFGTQGNGAGEFDRPAGVAVDPLGRIVVADKDNHRIQIFKIDGTFVLMFGEKGQRNGQFSYPWDVAVNMQGHIVVSDTRNHRIQVFTNDGIFLNKYGFDGNPAMWKHFDSPRGVCFTPTGNVIVTDFNNHRIVIIDHQFSQAQFLGQEGSGFKQFLRPQGIVCDDEGRIIVADSRNNRLQVFEGNGTFLWKVGQAGKGPCELDRPSGLCISPEGRIIVVDFGNSRVQII